MIGDYALSQDLFPAQTIYTFFAHITYMPQIRITVSRIRRPSKGVNDELQWLCRSLGMFNLRDKDKSCFRIFIVLLKSLKREPSMSSDEIAARLNLSRGTVIHHLNKLMNSGIVESQQNKYFLKVENLNELIDNIEKDIYKTLKNLRDVAKDLDKGLDL